MVAADSFTDAKYATLLIVAGISAAVALVTLVATLKSNRRGEARNKLRDLVAHAESELGPPLYDVVATAGTYMQKVAQGKNGESWLAKSREAAAVIKKSRSTARLPLGGCDEALRVMSRLPDWVAHKAGNDPERAKSLVDQAGAIRLELEAIMYRCFWKGRRPKKGTVKKLNEAAKAMRATFDERAVPEAEEFGGPDPVTAPE